MLTKVPNYCSVFYIMHILKRTNYVYQYCRLLFVVLIPNFNRQVLLWGLI